MIEITPEIRLQESEIEEEFVRASGPGGQNVNKVATAVQLRFRAAGSPALAPEVRQRLTQLAGRQMTEEGVLIIHSQQFRTQAENRQAAIDRLAELIRRAAVVPTRRRATRPTAASKRKRLETKRQRGAVKALRRATAHSED